MLYRRGPLKLRKFAYPNENFNVNSGIGENKIEQSKELETIPLPNEDSGQTSESRHTAHKINIPFLNFFNHISLEEIILFGLIFLLLDETIEDDFLLIILVYILITGLEHK